MSLFVKVNRRAECQYETRLRAEGRIQMTMNSLWPAACRQDAFTPGSERLHEAWDSYNDVHWRLAGCGKDGDFMTGVWQYDVMEGGTRRLHPRRGQLQSNSKILTKPQTSRSPSHQHRACERHSWPSSLPEIGANLHTWAASAYHGGSKGAAGVLCWGRQCCNCHAGPRCQVFHL